MSGIIVKSDLQVRDLRNEKWREYDFGGRCYRIEKPVELSYRNGGVTHRVVDREGVTHCLPAPGVHGCVLRWQGEPPVSF